LDSQGLKDRVHGVLVTLEPCNHFGRTPPCSDALVESFPNLKHVFIGQRDPNPQVKGGGWERLQSEGIQVRSLHDFLSEFPATLLDGRRLLQPFFKRSLLSRPWITLKTAHLFAPLNETERYSLDFLQSSMVPPEGQKTFTSDEALTQAHRLRKRVDIILTGAATAVTDNPLFTVRKVPDFDGKKRELWVVGRLSEDLAKWISNVNPDRFFQPVRVFPDWAQAYQALENSKGLEVLVEAGPKLTRDVLESGHWDEHHLFINANEGDFTDHQIRFRED
jgi:diaminohydroxyphosphoribosylaminopyrimidine deaminase/5-amino-6-(5-phosphoribosylamino)uracil reductase